MTARDSNADTKEGRRRWEWRSVVLCCFVAFLGLQPYAYAETRREPIFVPAPPSFRTDGERREVRIGGHRLCVPANYLTGSFYIDKPNADGELPTVLVVALLPELEGRTEQNRNEFFRTKGFGRRAQILIRKPPNNSEDFFKIYIKNRMKNKVSEIPESKKINDMLWYRPIGKRYRDDVFINTDNSGKINDFVQCSAVGSVPSPGCRHAFVHNDLLFKVSYGRSFLPEWQNIKDRVTYLFAVFQACDSP